MRKKLMLILISSLMFLSVMGQNLMASAGPEWQEEPSLPPNSNDWYASAESYEDKIYQIGVDGKVFIFDINTRSWRTGTPAPDSITSFSTERYDDKIYLISGQVANPPITNMYIYNITTDTWSIGPQLARTRYNFSSAIVDDKIYFIGGIVSGGSSTDVDVYNISTNTWSTADDMPTGRTAASTAVVGDKIYVFGGAGSIFTDVLEIYDTRTDTWTTGNGPGVTLAGTVAAEEMIYIFGGCELDSDGNLINDPLKDTYIYDTSTDTFVKGNDMIDGRLYATGTYVNGKVYAIGNRGAGANKMESLEINSMSRLELSVLLQEDETAQMIVTNRLSDNPLYDWASTNDDKADTDGAGFVTGLEEGKTYIVAESADGSYQEQIPVKVIEKSEAERLALYLTAGEEKNLFLIEDYDNINWSTEDPAVVIVDGMGKVTAVGKGLAKVVAAYEDAEYALYVRVG